MERTVGKIRKEIDQIDSKIIELLEKRIELCKEIALIKKQLGIPIDDVGREKTIFSRSGKFSKLFELIIFMCKEEEMKVFKKTSSNDP